MQSLGRVAREIGVEIRCGARVDQLRMEVRLFLSLPFLDVIDTSHLDTDADDSNNEDEDDENNLGLMTFPESQKGVLLRRMVEWQGWCLTLETRFLMTDQCVTVPKMSNDTNTDTFSRYQILFQFRFQYHQIFLIPVPRLFSGSNFF